MINSNSVIADLHIHSRYSRATSNKISIPKLVEYARIKGVNLLGTGDFQHPKWFSQLDNLEERDGILYYNDFPFLWQTEVSLMYKQEGKMRKVHNVILAPNKEVVKQVTDYLGSKGRIDYDGRPIFGLSCQELIERMKEISKDIEIIPAHVWTPWFSLYGSKSGFNSIKGAFGNQEKRINAIETGLSSDPEMNYRLSELNDKTIFSASDSHSYWPWRLGREATIFNIDKELSYEEILKQIRENSIVGTIEVDPKYGKYHYDGHRKCDFCCRPKRTEELDGACPKCGKPLTIGVENRVEELASQEPENRPNKKEFYSLLPLHELISLSEGVGINTKTVWSRYNKIIDKFGSEFNVLLRADREEMARVMDDRLAGLVIKNRKGKIKVKPGFDGRYGKALIKSQERLF